jgi:hypothetical protein
MKQTKVENERPDYMRLFFATNGFFGFLDTETRRYYAFPVKKYVRGKKGQHLITIYVPESDIEMFEYPGIFLEKMRKEFPNPSVDSSNSGRSEAEAERTARMPRPSRMAGLEGDGASAKGEERSPEVASGGIPTTVKAGCKGADGKPKRSRKRPVTSEAHP